MVVVVALSAVDRGDIVAREARTARRAFGLRNAIFVKDVTIHCGDVVSRKDGILKPFPGQALFANASFDVFPLLLPPETHINRGGSKLSKVSMFDGRSNRCGEKTKDGLDCDVKGKELHDARGAASTGKEAKD